MTTQILPANLLTPPAVPVLELEDLILQVLPSIENNDHLIGELVKRLKPAVENFLIAYRQAEFLSSGFNNLSPMEVIQIVEGIHTYKAMANECLKGRRPVKAAFDLFVANMDIEENGSRQSIH